MSTFDGSLSDMDAEESQATQLIHTALEKSPEPSEPQGRDVTSLYNGDISIDSFPSSKNSTVNSVRQYHFHGLAATQTDTQLDGENDGNSGLAVNEGSQNESLEAADGKAGKDIKWSMPSPDSRPPSPYRLSNKDNTVMDGRISKPKPPIVTFQSPTKSSMPPKSPSHSTTSKEKPVLPQPSRQRANHSRSPILSEDSFAQEDTQLKEEQFLVTSKKFTTPLADLARSDDDEFLRELNRRTETTKIASSSRTVVHDNKEEPPPVILVPSTPSQSGSSDYSGENSRIIPLVPQEQDNFERGQGSGRMGLDSDSSRGSQYSQGFDGREEVAEVEDLYSGMQSAQMPVKRPLPPHEDTYPETQLATQVATQGKPFVPATPSILPQTNASTYTHTGPRSLLSYMDPSKRGRYEHLIRSTPASPVSLVPQQYPAGSSRMTADDAETQLSVIPEPRILTSPKLVPLTVRVPPPHKPSPKKPTPRQIPTPSSVDIMDVVPDSEPMREQAQSPVLEKLPLKVDEPRPRARNGGRIEEEERLTLEENAGKGAAQDEKGSSHTAEEDDDDDDDEPLSAHHRNGKGKALVTPARGKGSGPTHKYTSRLKRGRMAKKPQSTTEIKQPTRQQRVQGFRNSKTDIGDTSHESAVPSSIPDQDHPPVRSRKLSLKAVAAAKEKENKALAKAFRVTSVARSSRSGRSASAEANDDGDVDMEAISDSERATEVAMDEVSEEEEYVEPGAPQQNLKRKRGQPPKSKSMNQATTTPRTRMTKRLKSAGSTISRASATRVFALWKQNKLWYSGTVYEHVSDNAYMIKFDDDSETVVSTEHMRTNNLRVGDFVRFGKKNKDFKVIKVNYRSNTAIIDFEDEPDELEFKEIGISTKVINSTWQDRLLDPRTVVAAVRDIDVKVKSTPSPSRSATSFLSLNNNIKGPRQSYKFLQKVGLIVSLGSNTNDRTEDGRSRSDILCAVRDTGGVVVDDLFKYLKMDILFLTHRWVIERHSVQWVGEPKELQRLFLLADNYNLKPKYLMALALGIPCLSIKWLYACLDAGQELDWRPYLLPQGRPTILGSVLPSQQVDLSWGEQPEHLFNIMENPVAPRLLEGQSVLCVGPDMTPRGKDVDKASFIIRIILAMGAKRVEAVRDVTNAANPLSQYDLLILREKEQYTRDYVQIHTVDWNWIKDSLIMSRRLAYPTWSIDEDSQCSQSL